MRAQAAVSRPKPSPQPSPNGRGRKESFFRCSLGPSPNPLPVGEGARIFSIFPVQPKSLTLTLSQWERAIQSDIFLVNMSLLILKHSDVEQLLPMNECITVMEEA